MKAKQLFQQPLLLSSLFLGLGSNCGQPQTGPDAGSLTAIPAIQGEVPLLGMGFSSLDANVTGNNCFTRLPIEYQKAREATLDFYRNLDYENLSHLIDAKVEIGVPVFPGVSAKGRVNYANEFAASDYAETMTLRFKATGESSRVYFGNDSVPEPVAAANLARVAANNDTEAVRRLCGDQYVASVEKGMELIATLKMEFNNSYDRNAFGGGFGAEILGGLAKVNVDVNYEKLMQDAGIKVTLALQQRGGDPLQLLSILPSAEDMKTSGASEEATISFLSCTYESRQLCYDIFRRVTNLAQNLHQQVKSDESDTVLGNMVPLSFEVRDYPTTNSMRLAALGNEEASALAARRARLEEGRRRLLLVNHDATEYRRRAENLQAALAGRGPLPAELSTGGATTAPAPSETMLKLQAIQTKSNEALRLVELIRADCYNYDAIRSEAGVLACLNGNNATEAELAHKGANDLFERYYQGDLSVRETDLTLDPQNFAEWCTLGYYALLGNQAAQAAAEADPTKRPDEIPEVIHTDDFATVRALVENFAAVPTEFQKLAAVCKNNEAVIRSRIQTAAGVLNLDGQTLKGRLINSVKPLTGFGEITQLNLANNRLEDVSALRELPNLKVLNLRNNKIRLLKQLQGFKSTQLASLDISRNVIGSGQLETLIGQADFKWPAIDLNGNVIETVKTLQTSADLKKLDLRGNPLSDLSGFKTWTPATGFALTLCQDKAPTCPLTSGTCTIAPANDRLCLRAD